MREVSIDHCNGHLYLTGMPGRFTSFAADAQAIRDHRIDTLIALVSLEETTWKSPEYAEAILSGQLPCARLEFPIPDFGIPATRDDYLHLVREAAAGLQAGKNLLIHCRAGIGRTGMLAASILVALGCPLEDALSRVQAAGSGPETDEQRALVEWIGAQS